MTPDEYIAFVMRSAPTEYANFHTTTISEQLVHAAIGMSTETGELLDVIKKAMMYGKAPDLINVEEELGDCLWYIGLACHDLGITFEQLFEQNIAKLKTRYPDKFDDVSALNRNLDAERATLEANTGLDVVSPRVGGAITRAFVKLTERSPLTDDIYLDPTSGQKYTYDGVQWSKVKSDAG